MARAWSGVKCANHHQATVPLKQYEVDKEQVRRKGERNAEKQNDLNNNCKAEDYMIAPDPPLNQQPLLVLLDLLFVCRQDWTPEEQNQSPLHHSLPAQSKHL